MNLVFMRARALEEEIDKHGEGRIAAFIAEPIQGAGGVIVPPDTYWPEVMRICKERDILFCADEVICGFGRMGEWFGSIHYDLQPDMISMAKGLSSAYLPIGAVAFSEARAQEMFETAGEFFHGYTYSGHPACCAAALKNIEIIEREGLIDRVRDHTAPLFAEKMKKLADHPIVGEVRTRGLLAAIELVPEKPSRKRFDDVGTVGTLCRDHCFANGLVMRAVRDTMVCSPPLVITDAEIDELVEKAWKSLDDTWAKVGKQFPGDQLESLYKKGANLPISLMFGDVRGATPDALLVPPLVGDPDINYKAIEGSLRPVPWTKVPTAQLFLRATDKDGNNLATDPLTVLEKILWLCAHRSPTHTVVIARKVGHLIRLTGDAITGWFHCAFQFLVTRTNAFEHRIAGADVNPYLLCAAVLAGIHHGVKNGIDPGPESMEGQEPEQGIELPTRWREALQAFSGSEFFKDYFGEEFMEIYCRAKFAEEENFHLEVSDRDHGCITGGYADIESDGYDVDADCYLVPDISTARAVPWANDPSIQIIHDAFDRHGNEIAFAPRNVLKRPPVGRSGRQSLSNQAYSLSAVDEHDRFIEHIYDYAEAQNLEIDTIIQESGAGQLEINLMHGSPLKLADEVFLYKRLIREAALQCGIHATFMAKPMESQPGSAMHVHQSVLNRKTGKNIFSKKDGSPSDAFYHFIGGQQKYMYPACAFAAPFVNSYRRLVPNMSAPVNLEWGHDNRSAGIRAPRATPAARRVENRVEFEDRSNDLPFGLLGAIDALNASHDLKRVLGKEFVDIFIGIKQVEHDEFMKVISPWEREHLLLNV
ncbi:Putrescine--pyruvate aminotransferase [Nymphon striatum]|nr:Putrescine--pyruvate aminotransferase [Nymphon striatum]